MAKSAHGWFLLVFAVVASAKYTSVYEPGSTTIIQYGSPRTATTLQYQIVTHMATLRNAAAGMKKPRTGFIGREDELVLTANRVFKTHHVDSFDAAVQNSSVPVLLFTTNTALHPEADERAVFVQTKESVEEDPLAVIDDYAQVFQLSSEQTSETKAYIRIWDIWRLCCGFQQSVINRLRLHGCPPLIPWYDAKNPHCELYNLKVIEKMVRYTTSTGAATSAYVQLETILREEDDVDSCLDVEQEIVAGKDFNGEDFPGCLPLVKHHVHNDTVLKEYACRLDPAEKGCEPSQG